MAFMLGTAASQLGVLEALAPLWTPANLAQPPAGWFDAMDASSFTTAGNRQALYSVWANKGYKGGQAQSVVDSARPTRSASSASDNNKPAILLTSIPLTIDLATDQGNLPSSMFAVARDNTGGEAIVAATGRATDATQDVRTLVIRNGTAAIDFAGGSRFQGTGPAVTTPQVVGFTVQTTGDQTTSVWANGVNGGDNFRSSPTGARVTIGQMPYYTPNPPVQALQELLLFDYALSTTQRQLVEGYLAHRWGTAASLPAAHPYKSAAPRYVEPWTPAALGTARRAHFDFSTLTDADGSTLSTITQNGMTLNGNAKVNSGYLATGMKSIRRTSAQESMTSTTNLGITGGSPRTVYIVAAEYEPGHNGNIAAIGGVPAGRQAMDLWCQSGSWAWHMNGPAVANGGALSRDTPSVLGFAYTGETSTGQMLLWQNGGTRGVFNAVAEGNFPITADGPLIVLSGVHGGLNQPAISNVTLDIGEIVVCNTYLSTADQQRMEGYLAHKWNLASRLPADHPYKSAPPTL